MSVDTYLYHCKTPTILKEGQHFSKEEFNQFYEEHLDSMDSIHYLIDVKENISDTIKKFAIKFSYMEEFYNVSKMLKDSLLAIGVDDAYIDLLMKKATRSDDYFNHSFIFKFDGPEITHYIFKADDNNYTSFVLEQTEDIRITVRFSLPNNLTICLEPFTEMMYTKSKYVVLEKIENYLIDLEEIDSITHCSIFDDDEFHDDKKTIEELSKTNAKYQTFLNNWVDGQTVYWSG